MGKIPYFWVFMGLMLAACTDGGAPSAGHINMRPEGMTPGRNPDTDVIRNSNYKVTGMIVTNDTQVDNYIAGKLRGSAWENKTPENTPIANAAIEIASGKYSTYDAENSGVWGPALWVVSHDLYSTCGSAENVAKCVSDWRTKNSDTIDKALHSLLHYAQALDITDAIFADAENTQLHFTVGKDGKIDSIVLGGTTYGRDSDSGNVFTAENGSSVTYNSGATLGQEAKLSYSDFGTYQITTNDVAGPKIAFAGGYGDKRIEIANVAALDGKTTTFTGKAIGTVANGNKTIDLDGSATLKFNDTGAAPVTTLDATGFSNWYSFTVTQESDQNPTIQFDTSLTNKVPEGFQVEGNGDVSMNVGYYGPNANTPIEATGLVQYTEGDIKMDMAFGVKQ